MYTCEWFLLCANDTDKGIEHPILGLVPCCERCAKSLGMEERRTVALASPVGRE